jgi:hypothetical protein
MAGLSISRKAGQTVVIESPGFALLMNVERTTGSKVELSFIASPEVRVMRGELFANIHGWDVYDRLPRDLIGQRRLFEEECEAASGQELALRKHERECYAQLNAMVAREETNELKEGTDAAQTAVG